MFTSGTLVKLSRESTYLDLESMEKANVQGKAFYPSCYKSF